ncbi:subtilisin-like protease [Phtheirospermum japonicum]|uniref:Subtilisin-like protease n=1 Tax=Phtheirospermum japonicum TaxID=374723 RepID=A0A830BVP5_9LAMI|nr:subtilisin-like protease [Phtheirospermum japonicum]
MYIVLCFVELQITFNYNAAGFSAKLSEQHLESLKGVDGFLSASRDELRTLHTTHSLQFLGLREGQGLWSAGNLGSDVIIGLVDTSARDSNGHGTHTASTAGGNLVGRANIFGRANGTAAGMRQTARIAAYKACYELGCADSAMDQAVKDGIDVLSLSLGGAARPYYNSAVAVGAFGAIKKGVIVSTSAGNSGPNSYTVTNVAPWLMTVAASSTDRSFVAQVRLGDGQIFSGASLFAGKPTKQLPLVTSGSLSSTLVKGKNVICVRGGDIGRVEKGQVVKAAGGAGMILANSMEQGEETFADAHVLPAISLGASDSEAIIKYSIHSNNTTASMGPNSVDPYILKPDVTAPGVNILAAWPKNVSPTRLESDKRSVLFNILSGTSMSCPHVSGLIALLKSLRRDWSPAAIKSALMTTAYVHDSKNNLISDAAAALNGSKYANPFRASDPGLIYNISTSDYLDHLCGLNYSSEQMALFAGEKFTCPAGSHFRLGDLNYPSFVVIFSTKFTGTTYNRTVTNVGIAVSTYSVKVIEPEGVSITVQPKVLKFRKMGENLSYKVTFKAKKGKGTMPTKSSFGSLEWVSAGMYSVKSPIAVTWSNNLY